MVLAIGHNSTWQKTYRIGSLQRGEVNRIDSAEAFASGKGANVVRALACLGVEGLLLGYAGGANGLRFRRALEQEGLRFELQEIEGETRICTTILEQDRTTTELIEPSPAVLEQERAAFLRLCRAWICEAELLIISGTSLPGEAETCYRDNILEAKRRGVPVLLDSFRSHGRLALSAGPQILKINLRELEALCGRSLESLEERKEAYRGLRENYGLRWVAITMGARGMEGFDGSRFLQAEPPEVACLNPIGSGDAAAAGVALCFYRGQDLAEALLSATALGSANCLNLKPGLILMEQYEELRRRVSLRPL